MYKSRFSNSFVKNAVIVFLFPIFVIGLSLRAMDYIFHKKKSNNKKRNNIIKKF